MVLHGKTYKAPSAGAAWHWESLDLCKMVGTFWLLNFIVFDFVLTMVNDQLVKSAVQTSCNACANAVDAHMNKQPPPHALHTTAGLANVKPNNASNGENKFFISVECWIKSSGKCGQGGTNPDCGS